MYAKSMSLLSSVSVLLLLSGCAAGPQPAESQDSADISTTPAPVSSPETEAIGELISPEGTPMGYVEAEIYEIQGEHDGDPRLLKVRLSGLPATENILMVGGRPTLGSADPCFDIGDRSAAGTPDQGIDVIEAEMPYTVNMAGEPEQSIKEIVLYVATSDVQDTSGLDMSCYNSVLAVAPLEWLD